jgi:iron complex outermembrane receptor protein
MSLRGVNGLLLAATSIFALAAAAPTLAQTASPSPSAAAPKPAADAGDTLPVVVVTAQKRSENVQKVAVALTVVGADVMKQNNITSAEGLDEVVPSLEFKKGTANVNSTLSIRGIGTQSFSSGAEPSVSTVVDGVVYGRAGMAFQEFTDIDHIEVAGGPQGTLFGKNASAGAVSITTKAPSSVFGGDLSFGYYEGGEYRADGNISGPITDTIRYTLSGVYGDYRGNVFNYGTAKWTNGYNRTGLRGGIVDNVNSDLKITLRADWTHADDNCCADILGPYIPGGNTAFNNVLIPSIAPVKAYFGSKAINNNLTPGTLDSNGGVSGQIDYSLGNYTITSITGWRNWRNKQIRDGDYHDTCCNYLTTTDIDDRDFGALNYNQYSQEFRLASPTSDRFNYVVGAFLWYTDENDWFTRYVSECTATTLSADATTFKPCSTTPGVSTIVTADAPAHWNTKFYNQAIYGQSNYKFDDKLTLTTGLRVSHDRVQYDLGRQDVFPAGGAASYPGLGATFNYHEHAEATGITAKGGLEYQLHPDNMVYFTYSRGYKGPSLNDYYSEGAGNVGEIAPETSNAYEFGTKNQFFGRRLTLNADIFYEMFDNFQANSFVNLNGLTVVTLKNAGTVRSEGAELMFTWRATHDLLVSGGYTFDNARIVQYNCAPVSAIGLANYTTCILHDGHSLPFAPKNKVNINTSYDTPLAQVTPYSLRLTSTYTYTSQINYDIDQTPLAQQAGYGLWDAAAIFSTQDGKYTLGFYVKNITNQYYTTFITPSGNGIAAGSYTRLQVPRDAQRYTGLKLTANF